MGKELRERLIGGNRIVGVARDDSKFAGQFFIDIDTETQARADPLAVARRTILLNLRVIESFMTITDVTEKRGAIEPIGKLRLFAGFGFGFLDNFLVFAFSLLDGLPVLFLRDDTLVPENFKDAFAVRE